jgi:plastocyanin
MSDKTLVVSAIIIAFLAGLGVTFLFLHTSGKRQADVISPEVVKTSTTTEATTTTTGTKATQTTTNTETPNASKNTTPTPAPQPAPKPSPTQTSKQTTSSYDATVIYNGNQFIPDHVTIPIGGTVRWVNVGDSAKMWVSSNTHPSDSIYPVKSESDCFGSSFNECEAVEQGGSWTFTFTKLGGWGYHNHVQARDSGTVNVVTAENYANHQY